MVGLLYHFLAWRNERISYSIISYHNEAIGHSLDPNYAVEWYKEEALRAIKRQKK